ncbi:MAG: DUF47 family protein, partial [Pseudomonadota bacterium]
MASGLLNIFSTSPFKGIQAHMDTVHLAAKLLPQFMDAVYAENWTDAARMNAEVVALENKADDQKRYFRLHLPSGLFLPVSRTDLVELLHNQECVANKVKDICGLISGR